MKLDMYLTGKKNVRDYDWDYPETGIPENTIAKKIAKIIGVDLEIEQVVFEIGRWGMSSHIHKWFIDNCTEGWVGSQESYIAESDLRTLREVCKIILNEHQYAEKLLPRPAGMNYDDVYFASLLHTQKVVDTALALSGVDFYYRAVWQSPK